MGKTQQTLWLAGFTGLSATCMTSFLFSVAQLDDPASAPRQAEAQPHALLAANTDSDQTITLTEVKQMLDGHFARLDTDNNGLIDRDEYAGRHLHLFARIDDDQDQMLTPEEVRSHRQNSSLLHMTTYQ